MEKNGIVQSIIFRNASNGYTVLALVSDGAALPLTCVGVMPLLNEGDQVQMEGEMAHHIRFGDQFVVRAYQRQAPSTIGAIIAYLSGGTVKGVGPSMARIIVSHFGMDTLRIMENEPTRLTEVPGIGMKKMRMIADSFLSQKQLRDILLALEPYGVTVGQALKMQQVYGDLCLAKVRENPYQLIDDIEGIGFLTADRIAQNVAGFEVGSLARIMAGIRYALQRARDERGDCYLPRPVLEKHAFALLGADAETITDAIDWMVSGGELLSETVREEEAIFLPYLAKMEDYIAKKLLRLRVQPPQQTWDLVTLQKKLHLELSHEQSEAVAKALNSGLLIITGGPGTGKTTIIRFIVEALAAAGMDCALAAPTGRAAKRMSEATGQDAATLHRLLEYVPGEGFQRNRDNPLLYEMVIVDELSMVDLPLMYALLQSLPDGTRLVLVGDSDQLPPVGCGAVLLDALRSGVLPSYRLTEIFRQAQRSLIVRNAHRINNGELPYLDRPDSDFIFEEISSADRIRDRLVDLLLHEQSRLGVSDPLMDVQVLVPMKTTALGVAELNRLLQEALNPPSPFKFEHTIGETLFRVGDKIMQIKNNYKIAWKKRAAHGSAEEGTGVFNGDLGTLLSIDNAAKTADVAFDDGRFATYELKQFDELDLAYCITIHKSQGSEFGTVILPLAGGPAPLLTRNLLYTAVTRAKRIVYCIGRSETIARMVRTAQHNDRRTALAERLIAYAELLSD